MSEQSNRLEELLILRASAGLSEAERDELQSLLENLPEQIDDSFELAAAACDLALLRDLQDCPESLKKNILQDAQEFFASDSSAAGGSGQVSQLADFRPRKEDATPRPGASYMPWLLLAASLVLAAVAWWPRLAPAHPTTPLEQRAQLLETPGTIVETWTSPAEDLKDAVSGDVVWSNSQQSGFMRIRGLRPNDPTISQYQLWIFDGNRDERFPVDGGVFDITGGEEIIIPIRAKLSVFDPRLFAVTVEPPGGVVVSKRDPIVLVAQVS